MTRVSAIIKNNSTLFSAITDYDLKLVALAWMNYLSTTVARRAVQYSCILSIPAGGLWCF
jgi:hypothetical protein